MHLTIDIPDDLAARLHAAGASPERAVLEALRRTADELEHAQHGAPTAHTETRTGEVLIAAMQAPPAEPTAANLYDRIHDRFAAIGGVDLELPPRGPGREPPRFD